MEGTDAPKDLLNTITQLIDHGITQITLGAEVNIVDRFGATSLHYSLSLGHYPTVMHLLKCRGKL